MRKTSGLALLVALALGCSGKPAAEQPQSKGIGDQLASVTSDAEVLKEAQAAANGLVQNAQDCDAVKSALPEVNRKLDEAASHVRTSTGKTTLDALKSRVSSVVQACP